MRWVHEALLDVVARERERLLARRGLLAGGVRVAAGGALALAAAGNPALGRLAALAAAQDFADDADVLNYALALEHLEYAFYRDGVGKFDLGADPFGTSITARAMAVRDHEEQHVAALTAAIAQLKGTPVEEGTYDFGDTDLPGFLQTAAALEGVGVAAYTGAAQYLRDSGDLLTAALTMHGVEARHAAYLNVLTAASPFPDAFNAPMTPAEVLKAAGPFIKS
jgi:Ferritin-like domain